MGLQKNTSKPRAEAGCVLAERWLPSQRAIWCIKISAECFSASLLNRGLRCCSGLFFGSCPCVFFSFWSNFGGCVEPAEENKASSHWLTWAGRQRVPWLPGSPVLVKHLHYQLHRNPSLVGMWKRFGVFSLPFSSLDSIFHAE